MAGIPGLQVTELDPRSPEGRATLRTIAGGPTNPNIGPDGMSNSGRGWAGARSPGPMPNAPLPKPATPNFGASPEAWGRNLGARAAPAAKAAGTLLKGAGVASAVYNVGNMVDDLERGDNVSAVKHGVDAAMYKAPLPVAAAWGAGNLAGGVINDKLIKPNQDLSDKIGGTLNGIARSTGKIFGQDWGADDTEYLMANAKPVPASPAPTARATPPVAQPAIQPAAAPVAVPGAPAAPTNVVTRNGNSFSGSGVREGFTYGGDGAPPQARGAGVTVVPASSFAGPAAPSLPPSRSFGDGGDTTGQAPGSFGSGETLSSDAARRFRETSSASRLQSGFHRPMGTQQHSEVMMRAAQEHDALMAGARDQAAMRRAQVGVDAGLRGQELSAATQRYATDVNAGVNLRGQDVQLTGQQMTAATARAQGARDQANKDREYAAGRNDKNFEQRQARESQLQKNIEARTVNPDGTPDPAAAAAYRQGIDRSVARLGAGGAHELSPMDEQRLIAGSDLLKTMKANAGWLPWQPDQLKTIDPVDLTNLRVLKNGDRQITRADSKAVGQIIPGRFFDTEEGVRFFGGTKTNRYDLLHEGK